jgi:hypothetical protein
MPPSRSLIDRTGGAQGLRDQPIVSGHRVKSLGQSLIGLKPLRVANALAAGRSVFDRPLVDNARPDAARA